MSPPNLSRRSFLRGSFTTPKVVALPLRPPWAINEALFQETCMRCDDCINACPENILERGDGGFPTVNFKLGECTFCYECAHACQGGALHYQEDSTPETAWDLDINISSKCLSLNAIVCRSCGDACEPQAIRFKLKVGGVSEPLISQGDCTGCGACLAVCPIDAVTIKPALQPSNPESLAA